MILESEPPKTAIHRLWKGTSRFEKYESNWIISPTVRGENEKYLKPNHQPEYMGVSKNRGKTPKMDGEHNGSKPYEQMDDLGG